MQRQDGLAKDLALAIERGRRKGGAMHLAAAVRPLCEAQADGPGGSDGASLARYASSR